MSGNTRHKVERACSGTCRVGRNDAQTPACRETLSGKRQTYNACITNNASSSQYVRCNGAGANSANTPQPNPPMAIPVKGATLLTSGPRSRSVSSSVAPSTAVAMPVAKPCRTRALISQVTLSA
ncbi:hypothetical protein D3C72_1854350 [compost metagenome]